jgi:hypothetical protein
MHLVVNLVCGVRACQPDGTLTKTRTVSNMYPSTESTTAQEPCCYTSNWTTALNAQCDTTTGLIAQVQTKAGNCDASLLSNKMQVAVKQENRLQVHASQMEH